ncbi:Na+/H+ antiporter NhaC family protein [Citricoccus sp. GCM10030269]|uniref:Na+/H+ antiporter NhaC family protein n=1 Tax=Citricoccus sp. GCM10030269 TaxID=3273388 RepID=UPI00361F492B
MKSASTVSASENEEVLELYGGLKSFFIPFGVLVVGIAAFALQGAAQLPVYWVIALAAIFVGLLLAKNKSVYIDSLIEGISSTMLGVMLLAWFLAGIMGKLLSAGGLIDGLAWAATQLGVGSAWFPLIAFVLSGLLSVSTGTAMGTVLVATPTLFFAGFAVGADPFLLLGAIIGGAIFGGNVAPVSDTTIISAYSQGASIQKVVKTRLPYAWVAVAITVVIYIGFAVLHDSGGVVSQVDGEANPASLVMLLVPALTITLMLLGRHFVEALLYSNVLGIILGWATGLLQPADIFFVDTAASESGGFIIEGIDGSVGVVVVAIFLMALIGTLRRGGVVEWLIAATERYATNPRRSELVLVFVVLIINALVVVTPVAMVMASPFVRRVGHSAGLAPWRRANLFDACSNVFGGGLPYAMALLVPYSMVMEQVHDAGYTAFSPVTLACFAFYCWVLLLVMLFAVVTGWRREFSTEEELEAEAKEMEESVV